MKIKKDFAKQDLQLLMQCMEQALNGDFSSLDESLFHDPQLPRRYNQVLEAFFCSNNTFVMRLNESMSKIGDSSCVKEMLEQLDSQTSAISNIRDASKDLGESIEHIVTAMQTIQENSHQVMDASAESVASMTQSIQIVDASSEEIQKINEHWKIWPFNILH